MRPISKRGNANQKELVGKPSLISDELSYEKEIQSIIILPSYVTPEVLVKVFRDMIITCLRKHGYDISVSFIMEIIEAPARNAGEVLKTEREPIPETITVPKGIKFLSKIEIFSDGLLHGYLINKGVTGCGGTTCVIESTKDAIIAEPYIEMIKNKVEQCQKEKWYHELMPVYGEIKDTEIEEYIVRNKAQNKPLKFMCTYEAVPRLLNTCGPNFFLLADEWHLLLQEYKLRKEAFRPFLNIYHKFKEWAFLTATPINSEFQLQELEHVPSLNIKWESAKLPEIKLIETNSTIGLAKKIIQDFLTGKKQGNAHFFVNSIKKIERLIEETGLTGDNCRAIWSPNNDNYPLSCHGVDRGSTMDEVKVINFYTSTCFEGCDLRDPDGGIFVISDFYAPYTLLNVSTTIIQIAGRIRDIQDKTITHIYKSSYCQSDVSCADYKEVAIGQAEEDRQIAKEWNGISEISRKRILLTSANERYIFRDSEDFFHVDPNLMKLDVYNFKLGKIYATHQSLKEEYERNGMSVAYAYEKVYDKSSSRPTFKDAYKAYAELMGRVNHEFTPEEKELIKSLESWYGFLDKAFRILGNKAVEQLEYKPLYVKRELIKLSDKGYEHKIWEMLKRQVKEGDFITLAESKDMFTEFYSVLELPRCPKGNDIKKYYDCRDEFRRIDGSLTRGVIAIKSKGFFD